VSAGTFVVPAPGWETTSPTKQTSSRQVISRATIAKRTQSLLKTTFLLPASHSIGKAFRGYEPAIDLFPVELWARIAVELDRSFMLEHLRRCSSTLFALGTSLFRNAQSKHFRIARSFMDRHAPTLNQAVLTEFISEGHFGHVRKMRQVYSDPSQLLAEEANRRLSGLLEVEHSWLLSAREHSWWCLRLLRTNYGKVPQP
jgi:hypothetical protein